MSNFSGELIKLTVSIPLTATMSFSFNLGTQSTSFDALIAKTWCDGQRIDLLWTNPPGTTQVKIRRSQSSFCKFIDDPGVDIYTGVPITGYVDGPGPIPPSYPSVIQSNVLLDENRFYYYTIFTSTNATPPYKWKWQSDGQVGGLSIKNYYSRYGDYVYNWLPRNYRAKDADLSLGADQFQTKRYCRMLQCAVNMYRGWLEGLELLRDPDLMPAGRIGVAQNQTGILQTLSWDLGLPPEKSFDAGVLRRIAIGLIPVYKIKGTCPGLIAFTKLFTTWDSTCDELISAKCGVDRVFTLWDGVSKINNVVASVAAGNPVLATGSVTVNTNTIFMANGITPDTIPDNTQGIPLVAMVLDSMGTFACVSNVEVSGGGTQKIDFTDPLAKLRSSITGTGSGIAGQFTISTVDITSYPWQFPSPAIPPKFGINAWGGYSLKDSGGNIFPIVSSLATAAGVTTLNVTGTPASGAFTIALAFDAITKVPLFWARLYTGDFSLIYDPKWDLRLINNPKQPGPFSFLTGLGATSLNPAPTPADVIIIVSNVANLISTSTAITSATVTDSTQAWTANQWVGYYVIPNWDKTKLFPIVANNNNTLTVDTSSGGGGVNSVSLAGSTYVILTESNALKYYRLSTLLPSFLPHESRGFLHFS